MKNRNGFTLIEPMISMAVTMLLLVGLYMAVKPALDLMAMEIGIASYNPNFATGMWLAVGSCATASGNQAYKEIQEATTNAITVQRWTSLRMVR